MIPLDKNLINKIDGLKKEKLKKINKFYKLNDKDSGQKSKDKIKKLIKNIK